MRKKKSYMNKNNILSEGVLDTIIKYITQYPKLNNSKEFKSGFKKRADGVPHADFTTEEKIGQFLSPVDVLDVIGLGFGVKQLIKLVKN